jgi:hypothetical protein
MPLESWQPDIYVISDEILNYPIRRRVWRKTVDVCDRDMTMDIWLIMPGICHITGHGKRPLHMTGHGKRPVIYSVYVHCIPSVERYILSIELNRDIPGIWQFILSISKYIRVYADIYWWHASIYEYTSLWSAYFTSGFRGAHRDAALREVVQPPISSGEQHDDRDADPCPPEDEECFDAPNVYEVNLWLWSFASGKPRLGGLSVEKTFERQLAANKASKERAAENRRRRKADKVWFKVKEAFKVYVPSIYWYIRSIWGFIFEIYLYIPFIRKSLSEQWFIKFRLRKTMQCVWDVLPIRSKHPRLPQR